MSSKLKHYIARQTSLKMHNLLRILFFLLMIFELLNLVGVFHLSLQFTWRGLLTTSIAVFIFLEIAGYFYHQKKGDFLHWIVWLLALISIGLDVIADIFHLYARFSWWDQTLHSFTSAVICFIVFIVISAFWLDTFKFSLLKGHARLRLALFLAATSTMTIAALYEVEEYTEDLIFGTNRLGPGTDTANDLMFNGMGIIIMVIVLWFILYKKPNPKMLS